jgi:hypothetical protein
LLLDYDSKIGNNAKVNPPIRSRADVEFLWESLLDGKLDWVCSDHACCRAEMKLGKKDKKNIFLAKSGFGGTEFMLPALITEGKRRGLSLNRVAELTSWTAARRFGLQGCTVNRGVGVVGGLHGDFTHALEHVTDFGEAALSRLSHRNRVVGVTHGLIEAAHLRTHTLGDGEAGGVVFRAVDTQARGQALQRGLQCGL